MSTTPSSDAKTWGPKVGPVLTQLLERKGNLAQQERDDLRDKSLSILGRCIPPRPAADERTDASVTGLAIGYVQSGKTLSFTTVSACAADNRFPLVIIITGTSGPLYRQTVQRLRDDLVDTRSGWRWLLLDNPGPNKAHVDAIEQSVAKWSDPFAHPEDLQTVLLVVMKNHRRLENLSALLHKLDLSKAAALVIDDEADQASLNNLVRRRDQSRTYQRILELKGCLPRHTYLQYTATPQAPLLINIIDVLSPRFASVLEPGGAYVDLGMFFSAGSRHVEIIPDIEIPTAMNLLSGIPPSLERALQLFLMGVCQDIARSRVEQRSMLVHPSKLTMQHADYYDWIRAALNRWRRTLETPEEDPDRKELVAEFRIAYDDLVRTQPDLDPFDSLSQCIRRAVTSVTALEVNARGGKTPSPDWSHSRAHILVGGTAVDRGFTVEGLTVTYMPRGPGVGNADTIQQRARFLGYKRGYFGICRVFVEQNVFDAYSAYVEHEADIRKRLIELDRANTPLHEWKRAFFLDRGLSPTRRSVLSLSYQQTAYADAWFTPRGPHMMAESVSANIETVNAFIRTLAFRSDTGNAQRTDQMRHGIGTVSLQRAYEELLVRFKTPHPRDSQEMTGLLLQVQAYLEKNQQAQATVMLMSWDTKKPQRKRDRGVRKSQGLELTTARALFQGAHPSSGAKVGSIYPGDDELHADGQLTIQIHRLRVIDNDSKKKTLAEDAYALAVWVPAEMERDTLVQDSL